MSLEELIRRIQNPKTEFVNKVKQLRIANTLDVNRYKQLKKELPYFTCGNFYPLIRRKENFTTISLFVIDLDHLLSNSIDIETLQETLKKNETVVAFFVSPGGDGLKVVFQLEEQCRDSMLFSAFYKIFVMKFAQKYVLEKVIDAKTSDVTRACFISWDENAFINLNAQSIMLSNYLTVQDFEQSETEIKEAVIFAKEIQKENKNQNADLTSDVLDKIKQKLAPTKILQKNKNTYIPPEIDELLPIIEIELNRLDIELVEALPLNYGKKIRVKAGVYWAELNLFFGKKGYTLVKTPKTGSNFQLAEFAFQAINSIINPHV